MTAKHIFLYSFSDIVMSSPALRCIQTAHSICKSFGAYHLTCVEPAIFENIQEYPEGMPHFMTLDELMSGEYLVNRDYTPHGDIQNVCVFLVVIFMPESSIPLLHGAECTEIS